jgi:hypothetical protein
VVCCDFSHRRRQLVADELRATSKRIEFEVRITVGRLNLRVAEQFANDW